MTLQNKSTITNKLEKKMTEKMEDKGDERKVRKERSSEPLFGYISL